MIKYACQALSVEAGGRCRNAWDGNPGDKVCTAHRGVAYELIERPDIYLVRFTLNERLLEPAREAGIPLMADAVHWKVRDARRQQRAEILRRKFNRYRQRVGDTGSLVFDPKIEAADLTHLRFDLGAEGYVLVRVDMKTTLKHGVVTGAKCTLAYAQKQDLESSPLAMTPDQERFADYLLRAPWDVYIYANVFDPEKDHTLDTVNMTAPRFGQKPKNTLELNGGRWGSEPIENGATRAA
jgi:hypothetical protein